MHEIRADFPVPNALRSWFAIHFGVDVFFAVPLFFIPEKLLGWLGWGPIDPFSARMVAAALFAIGIQSLLMNKGDRGLFKSMLNLKIIWSSAAIIGIVLTMIQWTQKTPPFAWMVLFLFLLFNMLWIYWRVRLGRRYL